MVRGDHLMALSGDAVRELLGPAEGQYTTNLIDTLETATVSASCYDAFEITLTEGMLVEFEPTVPVFSTVAGTLRVEVWSRNLCAVVGDMLVDSPSTGTESVLDLPAGSYEILVSGVGSGLPWSYNIYVFTPQPLTGVEQLADEECGYAPGCAGPTPTPTPS
jgi:hypothetical protein